MAELENKAKALNDADLETVAGGGLDLPTIEPYHPREETNKNHCPYCNQPAEKILTELLDTKEGLVVTVVTGVCPNNHKWITQAF